MGERKCRSGYNGKKKKRKPGSYCNRSLKKESNEEVCGKSGLWRCGRDGVKRVEGRSVEETAQHTDALVMVGKPGVV